MEKEEAVNLAEEFRKFLTEYKMGLSIRLEPEEEGDAPKEVRWKILVYDSFIIHGEYENMLDFIKMRNKYHLPSTRAEGKVTIIYTPRL